MSLSLKTFSAVRWTSAAAVFKALLQFLQLAVLARLLSPSDYGLMALVTVVLSFANLFADLGLNSAYVQKQEITQSQRSSLFCMNVLMSLVIGAIVIILSSVIADFFNEERLKPLLMLSASIFVLGALGQQVRASAEKDLNFKPLVLVEISSALIGFITAVIAALHDMGVYALVYGNIIGTMSSTLLAWTTLSRGWRPQLRIRLNEIKEFMGFGGAMVLNSLVNKLNMSIDLLIGGRFLGPNQLGLYSVPRNLTLQIQFLINPVITRVGFPLIAQIQEDKTRVRSVYLKTLNLTASANAPVYIGLAFYAPEIVHLLLGNEWKGSITLLRILAIWGLFRSLGNPVGSLLFGMGRADLALKWNIGLLFLVFPALWIGSFWEATGVAYAMLALMILFFIPGWRILVKPLCDATLTEYTRASMVPIINALVAILIVYMVLALFNMNILRVFLAVPLSAMLYVALSKRFNRAFTEALEQLAPFLTRLI